MRVTASAPGKLVLLGEYAVLEGAPALVLAVDRRARVALESKGSLGHPTTRHPGEGRDPVTFTQTGENQSHWVPDIATRLRNDEQISNAIDDDDIWEIVSPTLDLRTRLQFSDGKATWIDAEPPELAWLGTLLAAWPQRSGVPACRITLDSDPFYLDHHGARVKLGLGSSAALTVALLGALHALAHTAAPSLVEAIAYHRQIQHGRGSGIDIAASLAGGLSRFQLVDGAAHVTPARLPDGLHMACVYSGRPASTSAMLSEVAAWRAHAPAAFGQHMHGLATISSRGIDAIAANDAAAFLSSFHDYAHALADFGQAAGVDIASREHRALGALAADCGCIYKSCGAGGGDVGVTFSVDNQRLQAFAARATRAGFASVELQADADGLIVAASV